MTFCMLRQYHTTQCTEQCLAANPQQFPFPYSRHRCKSTHGYISSSITLMSALGSMQERFRRNVESNNASIFRCVITTSYREPCGAQVAEFAKLDKITYTRIYFNRLFKIAARDSIQCFLFHEGKEIMARTVRLYTFLPLLVGILLVASSSALRADGPQRSQSYLAWYEAGDVLRPDRGGPPYYWYLGFDAGLTYSSFTNGPLPYYMPNPHNPRYILPASVDEGNGLGWYIGVAMDLPISDAFGIVAKLNYHTRFGEFDESIDTREIHPETESDLTTILNCKTDWTFDYIGFDVLARIRFGTSPFYALIGPSFGFLNSNSATLTQTIVRPDDIYYTEDVFGSDEVVNSLRAASVTEEVQGFMNSRIDLKFGIGASFELNERLSLTPEITVAYPMGSFVDEYYTDSDRPVPTPLTEINRAEIRVWKGRELLPGAREILVRPNPDFNMLTAFFTIGLRWRM